MPIVNEYHFGLKISKFSLKTLEEAISKSVSNRKQIIFHGYALTMFYLLRNYKNIYKVIESFEYLLCDGRGFYYFMRTLGVKGISKITLPDLVYIALNTANVNNYRVYLLGTTSEKNKRAVLSIQNNYSGIGHVAGIDGYFEIDDEKKIVEIINEATPDILLVGISTPKKELFLQTYRKDLNVPVIINCGGMLDVLAGESKLPPKVITILGLSWLYRVIQEPKRLVSITLKNGILALFYILPKTYYQWYIKKNKQFSIPDYVDIM